MKRGHPNRPLLVSHFRQHLTESGWPASPIKNNDEATTLIRCSHRAMATTFEIVTPWKDDAGRWSQCLFQLIDDLESQLTVYHDESDVSVINRTAHEQSVHVEPGLFGLLEQSARLSRETWGAFDVTMGPLIRAWGFWNRQGRMPSPQERQRAWERVGMHRVHLDPNQRTIRFNTSGVEINLGSIGKGYAIDRCFDLMRSLGVRPILMHAGGSSVRVWGDQPGGRGWKIGIRHPWQNDRRVATVTLRQRALATSAATHQHFEYNRRKLGHILDPRTGRPAEGVASATAVAPTAAEADALATAFYVLGEERTRLYCSQHPEVGAIILKEGNDSPAVINLADADIEFNPPQL